MQILVPLDGSHFSEQALPMACAIARHAAGSLHLLHVHTPIPGTHMEGLGIASQGRQARRTNEQMYLEQLEQRLATDNLNISCALREGPVTATIIDRAEELRADVVVMTTHGHGGLARLWMGSTADELVRRSHVPILLVRPGNANTSSDAVSPIRRIAIPLDGSKTAEQILAPALALGSAFNAEYTLIRIVDVDVDGGVPDLARDPALEQELVRERMQEAQAYLDSVANRLRDQGACVQTRVLVEIEPVNALLREVRGQHYDLVALATHGRGGLPRLLLGSVADQVVRRGTIPVLVCHPQMNEADLQVAATTPEAHGRS